MSMRPKVLIIGGPTAAGKSDLAIDVARRFGATIVSADAMQVYRGMDIGTGKISVRQQETVPHVGIDVRNPDEPFDAADFIEVADAAIDSGRPVIVCGGTAMYIRALIRGLVATPKVDKRVRKKLSRRQTDDLYEELELVDPDLADRLHPNDRKRVIRGLEVYESTGRRLSELQRDHKEQADRIDYMGLWIDREDLDTRIDTRVIKMLEMGYVDEVKRLLRDYPRTLKPMQSLGYRHFVEHVLDDLPLADAVLRTQRDSRRFARKQRQWMKNLEFKRVTNGHLGIAVAAALTTFAN